MSMIGKISGKDWSKAPEGATHIKKYDTRLKSDYWYKVNNLTDDMYEYWETDAPSHWVSIKARTSGDYTFISKQEDLGMNVKQVKSIVDLEVGMFLKHKTFVRTVLVRVQGGGNWVKVYNIDVGSQDEFYNLNEFESWSYTYNGKYTPIIKESELTETQLKIKELEESVANVTKQIKELKELNK